MEMAASLQDAISVILMWLWQVVITLTGFNANNKHQPTPGSRSAAGNCFLRFRMYNRIEEWRCSGSSLECGTFFIVNFSSKSCMNLDCTDSERSSFAMITAHTAQAKSACCHTYNHPVTSPILEGFLMMYNKLHDCHCSILGSISLHRPVDFISVRLTIVCRRANRCSS